MIKKFSSKDLQLLWKKGDGSKLNPKHLKRIMAVLQILDAAVDLRDINTPGSNLHQLKGNLKGFHAVDVAGNWKIIFEFKEGDVYEIDYLDYH